MSRRFFRVLSLWLALSLFGLSPRARAYVLENARWPDGTQITLDLSLGAPGYTLLDGDTSWNQVAVDAMNIWNPYLGSGVQFQASYDGTPPAQGDGRNSVFFSDTIYGEQFDEGTLAVTLLHRAGTVTTETDVIVNRALNFDSYRGNRRQTSAGGPLYDLRRILIHEFGHVLGLDHATVSQAIMYAYISDLDTVQFDDINGVTAIYGPPLRMPVITSATAASAQLNASFTYQITATGGQLTYGASGLPLGLQISPYSGYITGTPTQSGVFTIGLTASNKVGLATTTLTLTVAAPPVITSPLFVTALVGLPFSYQITATGNPTSFGSVYVGLGLTYDQNKGLISGTPTSTGTLQTTISATNVGGYAGASLTINVEYDLAAIVLSNMGYSSALSDHPLTLGADGNFYASNNSVILRLTPNGQATIVGTVQPPGTVYPGIFVTPGLISGPDGNLYGTTSAVGQTVPVTVFRMTPAGGLTTLAQLTDDSVGIPHTALVLARDGNLYGTLHQAAAGNKPGAIFRVTADGTLTILHRFDADTEGVGPLGMIQASDGALYGTTNAGGPGGGGTVFKITPDGAFTVLQSFSAAGPAYPNGTLVEGPDGNLYGTTGNETALTPWVTATSSSFFRVTPGAGVTVVRTITSAGEGTYPTELVRGLDGGLYGMATTNGSPSNSAIALKRYTTDGTGIELHRFGSYGSAATHAPTVGTDGGFYCTTFSGAFERIVPGRGPGQFTYVSVQPTVPAAYASTGQQAIFTVSRGGGDDTQALPVFLTYDGAMGAGADGSPLPSTVVIPAGSAAVDVAVQALAGAAEGAINVHVVVGSGYDVNPNAAVAALQVYGTAPLAHPAFTAGEVALSNGVYYLAFLSGNPFGYYAYLSDPRYLYHFDMGYEYWFEANDGKSGVYLYDFKSSTFFYTSPTFPFPYLYDFSLNSVLYYYPDANNAGRYNATACAISTIYPPDGS